MIVVAGEALIDLLVQPDGRLSATLGGGPFNTARTIGRLDGQVAFLGCLASDRFGRRLRDALVADGVDLSLATDTDLPTTLAIAELDESGSAVYRFHTAETSAPALDGVAVAAALEPGARGFGRMPDALHVGTLGLVLEPMASALATGVEQVPDATVVMVDANCRPSVIRDRETYLARLTQVAQRADIIKVSADDLEYISPGSDPLIAAQGFVGEGSRLVLLTDGGQPVVVMNGRDRFEFAVPEVDVVDTVGAGDAFGGAFLARWIEAGLGRAELVDSDAVSSAVRLAIEVANRTCQRPGADPPRRSELDWPTP